MAIPAMAPFERAGREDELDAAAVADAIGVPVMVAVVGEELLVDVEDAEADLLDATSSGKDSPGLNDRLEFCANACWTSKVWLEFGFMTPTLGK